MRTWKQGHAYIALPTLLLLLLSDATAQKLAAAQVDRQTSATVVIGAARPIHVDGYLASKARIKNILADQTGVSSPSQRLCEEDRFAIENASAPGGPLPSRNKGYLGIQEGCARNHIEAKDLSLRQGLEAFDKRDYVAALALFRQAYAKMGTLDAALMLAKMHIDGLGTPKDSVQGIRWLREIVDAKFDLRRDRLRFNPAKPQAMNARIEAAMMLAWVYEKGDGASQDWQQAEKWYLKAADFGFVPALYILGESYLSGQGWDHSASKADNYFKEAAEAGYAHASHKLSTAKDLGHTAKQAQSEPVQGLGTMRPSVTEVSKDAAILVQQPSIADAFQSTPPNIENAATENSERAGDKPSVPDALAYHPASNAEPVGPQTQVDAAAVVRVTGLRAVPWKSYRAMRAALAAYEKHQALAPDAVFSFAVLAPPGKTLPLNFKLRVRTKDGDEFPVMLENGELFQLPVLPDPQADADFVSNFKEGPLQIGLLVHTRTIPAEKERLGDIRLRNEISEAIADVDHPDFDARCWRKRRGNECGRHRQNVWYKPRAPASAAWLIDRDQREALQSDGNLIYPSYRMPINAGHLSDNAIIEFDYKTPLPPRKLTAVLMYEPND